MNDETRQHAKDPSDGTNVSDGPIDGAVAQPRTVQDSVDAESSAGLQQSVERGHEVRGFSVRGAVLGGIGLLALTIFSMIGVYYGILWSLGDDPPPSEVPREAQFLNPLPLFSEMAANQEYFRKQQEDARLRVLNDYSWVDRDQEVVRIPIDEAIEMMVARDSLQLPGSANPSSTKDDSPQAAGGVTTKPVDARVPTESDPPDPDASDTSGDMP